MIGDNLILLILLALGLAFNNHLVGGAAGTLLVLKLIRLPSVLGLLERRSLDMGLFFLLLAVLIPFALGKVGIKEIGGAFVNLPGVVAILGGVLAAYLCGQGVLLLQVRPEVTVGLLVGTVIGVALLHGLPIGPLAAAGLTAMILNLLGLGKR